MQDNAHTIIAPPKKQGAATGRVVQGSFYALVLLTLGLSWLELRPKPSSAGADVCGAGQKKSQSRDHPVSLSTEAIPHGCLDTKGVMAACRRFRLEEPQSVGEALHVLRVIAKCPGLHPRPDALKASLVAMLLDFGASRSRFQGKPSLIDTRDGVRPRERPPGDTGWEPNREGHTDQLLATIAEAGVPLSHDVSTAGGSRTVADILRDAIANFSYEQKEIEWTAVALALYLPPERAWTNKYGSRFDFDGLVDQMLGRGFGAASSCAGTHLLYALTMILGVDDQESILSSSTHQRLEDYLARTARQLMSTVSADGTWRADWFKRLEGHVPSQAKHGNQNRWSEVLVTGHHLEWLSLLPPRFRPGQQLFLTSGRWLQIQLTTEDSQMIRENFCPYSHAVKVIYGLALPAS